MGLVDLPIERTVAVHPHAVGPARTRWAKRLDRMADTQAGAEIARRVREAIAAGLVYDKRPDRFGGRPCLVGQRFVMTPDGQHGWVVALDKLPDVVVVTTLNRLP